MSSCKEKGSSLVAPTPHRFRLFGKSEAKLRIFGKSSKHKHSDLHHRHGTGFLSLLMCCTFGGAVFQEKDYHRRQPHVSHDTARRTSSNNATTSQTITYSTGSVISKEEAADGSSVKKHSSVDESPNVAALEKLGIQSNDTVSTISKRSKQTSPCDYVKKESPLLEPKTEEDLPCSLVLETTTPTLESSQDFWLLKPIAQEDRGRKCLVLDLDETLVHSSFKMVPQADFVVPVEIDGQIHDVFVLKRPGVDAFMKRMGEIYEIVVFTASLSKYADPVLDMFDHHHVIRHRLFRESCFNYKGSYVKDLSQLGRDLNQVIILDNSPASYIFHTANAVPVSSWFNDPHDSELVDLIPFLEDLASVDDVTDILDNTIPGPFSHL
ncbi:hypothetical protein DFQ28_007533 [Apophysomyces sp. BC1034]|nr:hypothetical protein DFQ30_007493 [Apophysomyces sp. BC1015]KAG0182035.1 hypothetical protein DFQ29_006015 [Apophysomyces sp. BC1021]KAG0186614.1 hypothetical protein DFQ28_007533 [Apophysomyces sp. BC1034]